MIVPTDEQERCIEYTDGPLIVVAGAGTGKTTTLIEKIAYLVNEKCVHPSRVLAVTYTVRAAREMENKLRERLGDRSCGVFVDNFHSFCFMVVSEHRAILGLPEEIRIMEDTEKSVFMADVIRSLSPPLHVLSRFPRVYDKVGQLCGFVEKAKNYLSNPDSLARRLEEVKGGLEKKEYLELAEAVRIFSEYEKRKRELGLLDFGDLEVMTYDLFRSYPEVLREYQKAYDYILVDEFQDVNRFQIELIKMLAGGGAVVSAIGDDDQAIYGFRGASTRSFSIFREIFPDSKLLELTLNRRSTPQILDSANSVIRNNHAIDADFKLLRTDNPPGKKVEVLVFPDYDTEADAVANRIKSLLESGVPGNEIAVLARARRHYELLVKKLAILGIPYSIEENFLLTREGKDLLALLNLFAYPKDFGNLVRFLYFPNIALTTRWITEFVGMASPEDDIFSLFDDERLSSFPDQVREKLIWLREDLTVVRDSVDSGEPPQKIVKLILAKLFYLQSLVLRSDERIIAGTGEFLKFLFRVLDFYPDIGYIDFVNRVNRFVELGGQVPIPGETAGVRVMTVHQAKGKEFDNVFIIQATKGKFPQGRRERGISELLELLVLGEPKDEQERIAEERRLFFVAMTRARKHLVVSTVRRGRVDLSPFVEEMLEAEGSVEQRQLSREDVPCSAVRFLKEKGSCGAGLREHFLTICSEMLKASSDKQRLLDEFSYIFKDDFLSSIEKPVAEEFAPASELLRFMDEVSFSDISTYRFCPRKFFYSVILHIPTGKRSYSLLLGTLIHSVLADFLRSDEQGMDRGLDTLIGLFRKKVRDVSVFDSYLRQRLVDTGERMLGNFYKHWSKKPTFPLCVEKRFRVHVGGVVVSGRIDRVDTLGAAGIEIIDYKTGKPPTDRRSREDANLQLMMYAVAAGSLFDKRVSRVSFWYLGEDGVKVETLSPEEGWKSVVRDAVSDFLENVKARRFERKADLYKCRTCDYRGFCEMEER
ncbi:ATP-dependent helicase [bacterium]|nr:ATP-dependent helicase [bacterium]